MWTKKSVRTLTFRKKTVNKNKPSGAPGSYSTFCYHPRHMFPSHWMSELKAPLRPSSGTWERRSNNNDSEKSGQNWQSSCSKSATEQSVAGQMGGAVCKSELPCGWNVAWTSMRICINIGHYFSIWVYNVVMIFPSMLSRNHQWHSLGLNASKYTII